MVGLAYVINARLRENIWGRMMIDRVHTEHPRIPGHEIYRKVWPVLSWNQCDVQRGYSVIELAVSELYHVYTDEPIWAPSSAVPVCVPRNNISQA